MDGDSPAPRSLVSTGEMIRFGGAFLVMTVAFLAQCVTAFVPRLLRLMLDLPADAEASKEAIWRFLSIFNGALGLISFAVMMLAGLYVAALMLVFSLRLLVRRWGSVWLPG